MSQAPQDQWLSLLIPSQTGDIKTLMSEATLWHQYQSIQLGNVTLAEIFFESLSPDFDTDDAEQHLFLIKTLELIPAEKRAIYLQRSIYKKIARKPLKSNPFVHGLNGYPENNLSKSQASFYLDLFTQHAPEHIPEKIKLAQARAIALEQMTTAIKKTKKIKWYDLLESNVFLKHLVFNGWNALILAAGYHPEAVGPILEAIKTLEPQEQAHILKQVNQYGANALMLAARNHPEAVGPILEAIKTLEPQEKAHILKQVNQDGWNALMIAARYHPEAVRPILEAIKTLEPQEKAHILKQVTQDDWNTLMLAAGYHPEAVGPILEAIKTLEPQEQAHILKQVDQDSWNALMIAARNHPEAVRPILNALASLSLDHQLDIIKSSLSQQNIKNDIKTSMPLSGLILAMIQAEKQSNQSIWTASRAFYQRKLITLKNFYGEYQALKDRNASSTEWALAFQQARDDFEDNADILILLDQYEREINGQLCALAIENQKERLQAFASKVSPLLNIGTEEKKGLALYSICVNLFHSIDEEGQSLCVRVYYEQKDSLEELFYFLSILQPIDRQRILAASKSDFSSEGSRNFEIAYADYLEKSMCTVLADTSTQVVRATPVGSFTLVEPIEAKLVEFHTPSSDKSTSIEASAPPLESLYADTAVDAVPMTPLVSETISLLEQLKRTFPTRNVESFKRIIETRRTRQEYQELKQSPDDWRRFCLIKLAVAVDSMKIAEEQKDIYLKLFNMLADLSDLYEKLQQHEIDRKIKILDLWQDTVTRFMSHIDSKSPVRPLLVDLIEPMKQEKTTMLRHTNVNQRKKPAVPSVERRQTVSQTNPNSKKLWSALEQQLCTESIKQIIENATFEQLVCQQPETKQNIFTFVIQKYPKLLVNLILKINELTEQEQRAIMLLCNQSQIRLRNFLRIENFRQSIPAQRALYLLELQRVLSGLAPNNPYYQTLHRLHQSLSAENDAISWTRHINNAKRELKAYHSIWHVRSLSQMGYGIGLFKPSLETLLDELQMSNSLTQG